MPPAGAAPLASRTEGPSCGRSGNRTGLAGSWGMEARGNAAGFPGRCLRRRPGKPSWVRTVFLTAFTGGWEPCFERIELLGNALREVDVLIFYIL